MATKSATIPASASWPHQRDGARAVRAAGSASTGAAAMPARGGRGGGGAIVPGCGLSVRIDVLLCACGEGAGPASAGSAHRSITGKLRGGHRPA